MSRPLTNLDIDHYVKEMHIPNFRGVFMRDNLPKRSKKIECLILNHDSIQNRGTHWTAVVKVEKKAYYFDSFGKLPSPFELVKYLGRSTQIQINNDRYQSFDSVICGHLCLKFLHDFWFKNGINIDNIKDRA